MVARLLLLFTLLPVVLRAEVQRLPPEVEALLVQPLYRSADLLIDTAADRLTDGATVRAWVALHRARQRETEAEGPATATRSELERFGGPLAEETFTAYAADLKAAKAQIPKQKATLKEKRAALKALIAVAQAKFDSPIQQLQAQIDKETDAPKKRALRSQMKDLKATKQAVGKSSGDAVDAPADPIRLAQAEVDQLAQTIQNADQKNTDAAKRLELSKQWVQQTGTLAKAKTEVAKLVEKGPPLKPSGPETRALRSGVGVRNPIGRGN